MTMHLQGPAKLSSGPNHNPVLEMKFATPFSLSFLLFMMKLLLEKQTQKIRYYTEEANFISIPSISYVEV